MAIFRVQRVRDPVHGLIVFAASGEDKRRDECAWNLVNTPEFQRLRRIRQLGVSEFTFPGATHTRFAHSIGVFHTARILVGVVKRIKGDDFDPNRANVATLAALLHDVGHGPFSHAFEAVQKSRGAQRKHEDWSAEIIRNPDAGIFRALEAFRSGMAEDVAKLVASSSPADEYHAIVSSSFDADRLDYLRRDRLMTGSGAGAIDYDWLIDNIRIADVSVAGDDDEEGPKFPTFCLDQKALQAAEAFLLARFHLFEQVYLHKTTRGVETMMRVLLGRVAAAAGKPELATTLGLAHDDPLLTFFAQDGECAKNYLALDDLAVWAAVACMAKGGDLPASDFARRLRDRRLLKAFDVNSEFPVKPGETFERTEARRQREIAKIEKRIGKEFDATIFKDAEKLDVYGEIGADEAKRHKKLSILLKDGTTREITQLSPTIKTLIGRRNFVRYYGADDSIRRVGLGGRKHVETR